MTVNTLVKDIRHAADPVAFAREVLNFDPDPWQVRVLRSPSRRQLLNCCRQSGKSTTAAILGLHRALFYADSLVLLLSPSLRQSGELFRKVTDLVVLLPIRPRMVEENRLSVKLDNGSRIVSLPGKEGTIRGFSGASLIIEDESSRVDDNLYFAIRPMLAISGGRLVLMSTPFGRRGHFFNEWTARAGSWERTEITATECPRITPEFLEEERASLGEWLYQQEYFCQFVETEGQYFPYDLIHNALSDDVKPLFSAGCLK